MLIKAPVFIVRAHALFARVHVLFARVHVLFVSAHLLFVSAHVLFVLFVLVNSVYIFVVMRAHRLVMSAHRLVMNAHLPVMSVSYVPIEQLTRLKRHVTRRTCKIGTLMYPCHVPPEVRYTLAAHTALYVLRPSVLHQMSLQRAAIGEALGTLVAQKAGTLVSRRVRRPLVLFERPRIRVAFVTLVAFMRLLASVAALMLATRPLVNKPLAADVTRERAFTAVRAEMSV